MVAGFEFARAITWERLEHEGKLSPILINGRCRDRLECSYEDYAAAQDALCRARSRFADIMASLDVLLTPVAVGGAPEGLLATVNPVFNIDWTALGVPALNVPVFHDRSGLPVGVQLIGAFRRDRHLLTAARAIAAHLDVPLVRPIG